MPKRLATFILPILCLLPLELSAQQEKGYLLPYIVEGRDTLYLLDVPEAVVARRATRKQRREWKTYYRMVYNLKKVYPYTQIAKRKLAEMNQHFIGLESKKERKEYIKTIEKEMFREFEGPLRKLSISQGKMLIKLIDRETGQSSYALLKELKGGFSAFFWQNIAKLFGSSLKLRYDKHGEDAVLEELVKMCENGTFDALYYSMYSQ